MKRTVLISNMKHPNESAWYHCLNTISCIDEISPEFIEGVGAMVDVTDKAQNQLACTLQQVFK